MKILIVLALAVAAQAFPESELIHRSIEVPVIEGRITNGERATAGQFPYQIGLSLKINAISASWCGGSLIGSEWVLTAAHCTDGVQGVTVYAGATKRTDPLYTVAGQEIHIHPGWNSKTLVNDISLIKIQALPLSDRVNIIKLPARSNTYSTYAGTQAVASGWGRTSDSSNSVAADLMYVYMDIITNALCANTYGSVITKGNICVNTKGGKSTCNGDSGGPLVPTSGDRVLIGVTSFGAAAGCELGYPASFTRVTEFLDWIASVSKISY